LVDERPDETIVNIDNYKEWYYTRYFVWGPAAWPPPGLPNWVPEPIGSEDVIDLGEPTSAEGLAWYRYFSNALLEKDEDDTNIFRPWDCKVY
jgi:hypothetical protein